MRSITPILRLGSVNEVTDMGLFDVFSKGGKYFGKAIEPKCEYCEFGKRSSDGDKVLCTKKGMVDASFHCPKFVYSPLKRIPVKQLERVGWLEGDYDEKDFAEDAASEHKSANAAKTAVASAPAAPAAAPAPEATAPAVAPAPAAAAPTPAPASAPAVPKAVGNLDALAALAEAAGDYNPEAEQSEEENKDTTALSSM